MAGIWRKLQDNAGKGAQVTLPAGPPPAPDPNVHSIIAGNGQHYVVAPRTGGMPWIGHQGRAPVTHGFGPSETFNPTRGGLNMPAATQLRATVPAVINQLTGQAAGTQQMAPGGGVYMPPNQTTPASILR
jgi:hypothetical protein